jgi:hypothetical protein
MTTYSIERIDSIDIGDGLSAPGFYIFPDQRLMNLLALAGDIAIKINGTGMCYDNKISYAYMDNNAGGFRPNFFAETGLILIVPRNMLWQGTSPGTGVMTVLDLPEAIIVKEPIPEPEVAIIVDDDGVINYVHIFLMACGIGLALFMLLSSDNDRVIESKSVTKRTVVKRRTKRA